MHTQRSIYQFIYDPWFGHCTFRWNTTLLITFLQSTKSSTTKVDFQLYPSFSFLCFSFSFRIMKFPKKISFLLMFWPSFFFVGFSASLYSIFGKLVWVVIGPHTRHLVNNCWVAIRQSSMFSISSTGCRRLSIPSKFILFELLVSNHGRFGLILNLWLGGVDFIHKLALAVLVFFLGVLGSSLCSKFELPWPNRSEFRSSLFCF